MHIGVYPGSFDPITYGHLDIIRRSATMFDKVIVAVVCNVHKKSAFTVEERMDFIKKTVSDIENIEVSSCDGLIVNFAKECKANSIIRGLRAVTDFEYELQMAQTNSKLSSEVDTVFLASALDYAYLSSSIVKEVAYFNGDIKDFVPKQIINNVRERLKGEFNE